MHSCLTETMQSRQTERARRATELCRTSFDLTEGVERRKLSGRSVSEFRIADLMVWSTLRPNGSLGVHIWEKRAGRSPQEFNERWHKVFTVDCSANRPISITTFKRGDWESELLSIASDRQQAA
jgi:hypothetical protein